jgi:hypothetical protein
MRELPGTPGRHDMTRDEARLLNELETTLREIFAQYGRSALWSKRLPEQASPESARAIAYTLRREGPAAARPLAERIEELSDAIERVAAAGAQGHRAQPKS